MMMTDSDFFPTIYLVLTLYALLHEVHVALTTFVFSHKCVIKV